MATYKIDSSLLTAQADEIRTLNGTTTTMNPSQMTTALQSANAEVAEQEQKVIEITEMLQGKAIGGSGSGGGSAPDTCTVTLALGSGFSSGTNADAFISVVNEDGSYEGIRTELFGTSASTLYPPITLDNILVGSLVVIVGANATIPAYTINGDAEFLGRHSTNAHTFIVRGDCSIAVRDDD